MKTYLRAAGIIATALVGTHVMALFAQSSDQPEATHRVSMTTSIGMVEMELYGKDAPKTVKNFVELAGRGYYDGVLFHKVIPGLLVQTGDPKTKNPALRHEWGKGGESIYGAGFPDEINAATPSFRRGYVKGTLAMASRHPLPNSNTSQFFIMLEDNVKLPQPIKPNYTIFGKVTKGMETLHTLERMELIEGLPKTPVKIVGISIITVTK